MNLVVFAPLSHLMHEIFLTLDIGKSQRNLNDNN